MADAVTSQTIFDGEAVMNFAKGGSIDGIAQRGKTKRVTMKNGGSC
jgi:hypothetical protein